VADNTPSANQNNNNAPASAWDAFVQFWNPSIPTSTLTANYYQAAQYGNVPTIPEPSATTTPQQQAAAVQQAITGAEAQGTWQTNPDLGITATDVSSAADTLKKSPYTTGIVLGVALLGGLILFSRR
jgi:hypothetical protein